MPEVKRLRVFAGPNGSGKSALFEEFSTIYKSGVFINADKLEKEISSSGFLNLRQFGLQLTENDLQNFLSLPESQSLIEKSHQAGHRINLTINDNVLIDNSQDSHSYEASLIASFLRAMLIRAKHNFAFETVMSHESKLNELHTAKTNGYKVYFYFICLDDPELNILRVQDRVNKGGHNVSPDRVHDRYHKTLNLLLPAIRLADKSYLFDNSESMLLIAEAQQDTLTTAVDQNCLPNWFTQYVINRS